MSTPRIHVCREGRALDLLERALRVVLIVGSYGLAAGLGVFGLFVLGSIVGLVDFGDWSDAPWLPWVLGGSFLVLAAAFYRFARDLPSNPVNSRARPNLFLLCQVLVVATAGFLVSEVMDRTLGEAERSNWPEIVCAWGALYLWHRVARRWPRRKAGTAHSPPSLLRASPRESLR